MDYKEDTYLRVTKQTYEQLKKALAAEIGRRGEVITLKDFAGQVITAGIAATKKKKSGDND